MKLFDDFIKVIYGRHSKSSIVDDCDETKKDLATAVPAYVVADSFFKVSKFTSEEVKSYAKEFMTVLEKNKKIPRASTFLGEISARLNNLNVNFDLVSTMVDKVFENNILSENMTVQQAVILRCIASVSWAAGYAIDLLNFIYRCEEEQRMMNLPGASEEDLDSIPPVTFKRISTGAVKFAKVLGAYGIPPKDFSEMISVPKEVLINSSTKDNLKKIYSEYELDPFADHLPKGLTYNPIYMIRMAIASWQIARHNVRKDKKKQLELRILHLKALNEKKNDIGVQKEISYTQDRIDKLDKEIRDLENEYEV